MERVLRWSENILNRNYQAKDIFRLAGFLVLVNIVVCVYRGYLGFGYPFNTFLFLPEDRFGDMFKLADVLHVIKIWDGTNHYEMPGMFNIWQLPFNTMWYYSFTQLVILFHNKYVAYGFLMASLWGANIYLARKKGNSISTIFWSTLTYPVVFVLDRGNFAIAVYVLIFFALTIDNLFLATLAVAVATSLKISPVIFIVPVILLGEVSVRRVCAALSLLLLFVFLINYLSILFIGTVLTDTTFDPAAFTHLINFYYEETTHTGRELILGSSFYAPALYLAKDFGWNFFVRHITAAMPPLFFLAIAGATVLIRDGFQSAIKTYFSYEKVVFVACMSFVLFMPFTSDYYLLILFLPLLLFPKMTYSMGFILLFGLLLGAKNIYFIKHTNISYQIFVNPMVLLLLWLSEFGLVPFVRRGVNHDNNKVDLHRPYSRFIEILKIHKWKLGILAVILVWMFLPPYLRAKEFARVARETHNRDIGLPLDFNPQKYIELNPKLWDAYADGINMDGPLLNAEIHYINFGKKAGLRYK